MNISSGIWPGKKKPGQRNNQEIKSSIIQIGYPLYDHGWLLNHGRGPIETAGVEQRSQLSDISPDTFYLAHAFSAESKAAIYEVMYRRDIRCSRSEPPSDEALAAIVQAAHHASSVGFMQPWNFVLMKEQRTKQQVALLFEQENALAATVYENERQKLYRSLK
jgi:hypothetical protein